MSPHIIRTVKKEETKTVRNGADGSVTITVTSTVIETYYSVKSTSEGNGTTSQLDGASVSSGTDRTDREHHSESDERYPELYDEYEEDALWDDGAGHYGSDC